mmetsp:Transcript_105200/g.250439  ORF Transcript_105200/g.250439 Transcript_105200/m.250439 type:complete len:183 (+) Transcript_105200:61-609(+)
MRAWLLTAVLGCSLAERAVQAEARARQLKEVTRSYEDQVKGKLVDAADVHLHQKEDYEKYMGNYHNGAKTQERLVHQLRRHLKKKHNRKTAQIQHILDAQLADLENETTAEDEDEEEDADEDEDEEVENNSPASEEEEEDYDEEDEEEERAEEESDGRPHRQIPDKETPQSNPSKKAPAMSL